MKATDFENRQADYISALENSLRVWTKLGEIRDINPIISELTIADKAVQAAKESLQHLINLRAAGVAT